MELVPSFFKMWIWVVLLQNGPNMYLGSRIWYLDVETRQPQTAFQPHCSDKAPQCRPVPVQRQEKMHYRTMRSGAIRPLRVVELMGVDGVEIQRACSR